MNGRSQTRLYAWKRYWIPQGQDPVMQNGYFVEPALEDFVWAPSRSNGVALSALRDVPCLVLLGDMGMGKSTVVLEEAGELPKALIGKKHEIVYGDLRRLSETQIYRQVFSDPKVEGWRHGNHTLTLILDSLDECWRRIDELEAILVGEIERCLKEKNERSEEPQLFLRLTCRAAEWRGHVGDAFRRLFSTYEKVENPVRIYTLAPLSENNIRQAAESVTCVPDDLLQRIAEKEAQPLASHPITFGMLFQAYRRDGEFPGSRVELYEHGCLGLCSDPQSAPGSKCQRATNPHQRLAIASRLAALSVLTNRYLVNGNSEQTLARPDVLDAASAFGYFEEEVRGERVEVNRTTISEALSTALFGESIDGLQTWRHQSYAEFLGARYLVRRGLPAEQIVALLADTTDNAGRLIPQLEETGRWVADMAPPAFDLLATCNAEVFIRCDPRNLDDKKREILVSGYLDLIRRHETPELDWQLKNRLARLGHPGLGTAKK